MPELGYFSTIVTDQERNNWECIDKYSDPTKTTKEYEHKGLYIKEYKGEEWGFVQVIKDIYHSIITFGCSARTLETIVYTLKGYRLHDIYMLSHSNDKESSGILNQLKESNKKND